MRRPFRRRDRGPKAPANLRRSFVTPEGVDLQLDLGSAGGRAAAFLIDALIMLAVLIVGSIAVALLIFSGPRNEVFMILWLVGFFLLRNSWFILFEMGQRGATPGKRLLGLRVVARDGGRLSGGAVMVRNAMREIEVFLPLSFLGMQAANGAADGFLTIFALSWSGIFLFFPLFNHDRLRIGDMLAGTWVVNEGRARLGADLSMASPSMRSRRTFSDAALNLYGIYELQTLEDVLRKGDHDVMITVAAAIRRKAGMIDDGDDYGFLYDYYTALCARLERGMMVGRRREDKHSAVEMK